MKKTIIHRISITEPSEKVRFQIRLPRNTKSIENIRIHCPEMPGNTITHELGSIWLTIPERRDTFYCDIVRLHFNEANIDTYSPIRHISQVTAFTHWTEGTMYKPFTVFVCGAVTLIEGFYSDLLGANMDENYTVQIYLTLEI
jgi:hypothetical protein